MGKAQVQSSLNHNSVLLQFSGDHNDSIPSSNPSDMMNLMHVQNSPYISNGTRDINNNLIFNQEHPDQIESPGPFFNGNGYDYGKFVGGNYSSSQSSSSSSTIDDRTNSRRLKNRESAARSRQKIKNQLTELEKKLKLLEDQMKSLANERKSVENEVNELDTKLFNLQLKNLNDSMKTDIIDLGLDCASSFVNYPIKDEPLENVLPMLDSQ